MKEIPKNHKSASNTLTMGIVVNKNLKELFTSADFFKVFQFERFLFWFSIFSFFWFKKRKKNKNLMKCLKIPRRKDECKKNQRQAQL